MSYDFTDQNKDPFTILLEKLWEVLEANPVLAELSRTKNRIKYLENMLPKEQIAHGDLPEIVLMPDSDSQDEMGDSATGYLSHSMRFFISTGNQNPRLLNALRWELYRVIQTFMAVCGNCHFRGQPFIVRVKMMGGDVGISNPDNNRRIAGWSASWGLTIDMQFSNSEIIYQIQE